MNEVDERFTLPRLRFAVFMLADERLTEADARRAISRFVVSYNKHNNQRTPRLLNNGNYTQLQFT